MRFIDMQSKDVINIDTGCKIGYISDLEFDPCFHKVLGYVIEKKGILNYFKFIKGGNAICIPCENIISVGKDVILVKIN